VESWVR